MRILHLGNLQVVPALRALGHDVRVASQLCPLLVRPGKPVDVRILHREIAPDAEAFFMVDTLGRQTLAYGIEELPIPRVYWAIDVHLNFFWQRPYAALFDLVLAAQRDYVPLFEADGTPARWLPWGIDPDLFCDRSLERAIDVAFVGMIDENRPKRAAAVAELRRRFGLVTFGEDAARRMPESKMAEVFGSAKIVFNESVLGDVNFRTFEAMACGALLLTERVGNGLRELFTPGEHLAVYEPDDLVAQVAYYLGASHDRRRIARAGANAVATRHTMGARMAVVTDWLTRGVARRDTRPRAASAFGQAAHLTIVKGLSDAGATMRLATEQLQAATLAGGDVDAAIALAEIMAQMERDDGALAVLGIARGARPDDPRAWLLAGEIERRRGRLVEAAAFLRAGVAAAGIPDAVRAEALAALPDGGDLDAAAVDFALGLVLQAAGMVLVPGFVRYVDAGLPRTAYDYFMRSLARAPNAPRVTEHVAAVLELAGRDEYARGFRERLVCSAPADPDVRSRFARVLHRSYAFTEGAHQARVALVLARGAGMQGTPAEQGAAYREAGLALLRTGQPRRAAQVLEQALALAPSMSDTHADVALAHLESGDFGAATRHLQHAIAAAPADRARFTELLALLEEHAAGASSGPTASIG